MTNNKNSVKQARFYVSAAIAILLPINGWSASYSTGRSSSSIKTPSFSSSKKTGYYRPLPRNTSGKSPSSYKSHSGTVSSKFGKSYNSSIEQHYAGQASKKSFEAFRKVMPAAKPMHFPEADLQKYRSRYRDNPLYRQAGQDHDSWGSRDRYYQSHPPVIVNGGGNSFGMLSGLFLYSLLNNSASAGEYAFNHQNDADYLKWRAEADQLAKDNAELKAQLEQIDAVKNAKGNAQPDPNWLPPGVPVSAVMSDAALKSSQPDFNVCVGSEGGPYYKVAQTTMLPELVEWVNLNPVITQGTPDILAKLASGACDAGFIQGDARFDEQQLEVLFKPFLEAAHLACSVKSNAKSIHDIADKNLWIPKNSGSRMTWDRFVELNPVHGKVNSKDAINYEDAILKAMQTDACLFYMAAPHAAAIDRLIDRKELKLLAIDDERLTQSGVYQARTLSSGDYSKAIQSSLFSDHYIRTVVTPATFVMNTAWKSKNPDMAAKIALKLADIEITLKQSVKQ